MVLVFFMVFLMVCQAARGKEKVWTVKKKREEIGTQCQILTKDSLDLALIYQFGYR